MNKKERDKIMEKVLERAGKRFAKDMKEPHKCVFTGKQVGLDKIIKSEKQFRMCMWCRLNNLLMGITSVSTQVKQSQKANKGRDRPSYIG